MIKESLSTLKSLVGSAVKTVASDYTPTAQNMGGAFTRIAQQGIANLSYRSPILADVATTMLHSFQNELVQKDKIKKHIGSEDSNQLRAAITEKLGADASKDKVDKEMFKVIDKMSKIVDKEGQEAASKSSVFKEFGEYFKNFRKEQPKSEPGQEGSTAVDGTLGRIDVNTKNTAQLLSEIASGEGSLANPSHTINPEGTPVKSGSPSFIDPMTGMPSIKAAIGSIGGSFLGKVFDDELLTKYAAKLQTKLFDPQGEEELKVEPKQANSDIVKDIQEPKVEPVKRKVTPTQERQSQNIQEILKGISLDLGAPKLPESFVQVSTEDKNEGVAREVKKEATANSLLEQIIEQLKKLNDKKTTEGEPSSSSDMMKSMAEKVGGNKLGKLGNLASKVPKGLGSAAMVAAAGAAGYGVGTLLNPVIDSGITALSGEENTLGTWIYNKTHDDELSSSKISPKKSTQITDIQKASKAKEEANSSAKLGAAPVVLNSTQPVVTNNNSTTVIATSSVRNQESTFERVQFQDYWSRVA